MPAVVCLNYEEYRTICCVSDKSQFVVPISLRFFGEKCYLEITAQDETLLPITKKVNQFIYNLAKQTNTKLIVDNEYRYLKEKDKEAWEIALSIKD